MNKPILIGAAVETELEFLINKLENVVKRKIDDYDFWEGMINSFPVVVYKTEVGTINATMSTVIAIKEYNPMFIVNEGTAGSHINTLLPGDIVIGKEIIAIDSYKSNNRKLGEGSNPFEWSIAGFSNEKAIECDKELLNFALKIKKFYHDGKVYVARIGSGNVFNKEADRIKNLYEKVNTVCEEMEGIGVYKVCNRLNVPVISFRVISNNEILGMRYDVSYGKKSQIFSYEFVKRYIEDK